MMKIIINALKIYQQIYKSFYSSKCKEVDTFIELLRPYERDSIHEFAQRLEKNKKVSKSKVLNSKQDDFKYLGIEYYKYSELKGTLSEELQMFFETNKNEKFITVLGGSLEDTYNKLEQIDSKNLKIKQIKFLGYALFNVEVKGKTKEDQKQYLLQLLGKSIQTQKMNEIYDSAL